METAAANIAPRGAARPGSISRLADRIGPGITLATVWAHPDDESYLGAGLMAAVADRGGRVVNVTATLGEHGTDDPEQFPPTTLAALRRVELDAALDAIGAESAGVLGYEDGTCEQVTDEMGARRIGVFLDEVDPDLVLTFGPDGVTGHADHRAVARWVARAVADRRDRMGLVTTAAAAAWPDDLIAAMHRVDAFYPGYPDRSVSGTTWIAGVDGELLERKLSALHAHASQIGPLHDALGPDGYRRLASIEGYRAANQIALRMFSGNRARAGIAA
jgi:LmbE family N-acetylglucosaminyl deacetylase